MQERERCDAWTRVETPHGGLPDEWSACRPAHPVGARHRGRGRAIAAGAAPARKGLHARIALKVNRGRSGRAGIGVDRRVFWNRQTIKRPMEAKGGNGPMKTRVLAGTVAAMVTIALLAVVLSSAARASRAAGTEVSLAPGAGAPGASGQAEIEFAGTVLNGTVSVEHLPPQPFGSGHFYGAWFVRTDTGDKAFLGALIGNDSIIFAAGGAGTTDFAATGFTTGPDAGSPITLGPAGTNLIIVLIEDKINGLTPSPVGVAASGTF